MMSHSNWSQADKAERHMNAGRYEDATYRYRRALEDKDDEVREAYAAGHAEGFTAGVAEFQQQLETAFVWFNEHLDDTYLLEHWLRGRLLTKDQ